VQLLVVDGANVMGSLPGGWWRDRAGAARRLREQLAAASLPYDEVVLVLEGEARRGTPEGRDGGVVTVHAPRSGDDAVVELVSSRAADRGTEVLVATADRELRMRVEEAGGRHIGPGRLLALL